MLLILVDFLLLLVGYIINPSTLGAMFEKVKIVVMAFVGVLGFLGLEKPFSLTGRFKNIIDSFRNYSVRIFIAITSVAVWVYILLLLFFPSVLTTTMVVKAASPFTIGRAHQVEGRVEIHIKKNQMDEGILDKRTEDVVLNVPYTVTNIEAGRYYDAFFYPYDTENFEASVKNGETTIGEMQLEFKVRQVFYQVRFNVWPPNAALSVDDSIYPKDKSWKKLTSGEHRYKLSKAGFVPDSGVFSVPKDNPVIFKLNPKKVEVVFVDDRGLTDEVRKLMPGTLTLKSGSSGTPFYAKTGEKVSLIVGTTYSIDVQAKEQWDRAGHIYKGELVLRVGEHMRDKEIRIPVRETQ